MTSTQPSRVRVEQSPRRVRALLHGRYVLDTKQALLVWEGPHYPAYYIPREDVLAELVPTGGTKHSPSRGDAAIYDVALGDARAPAAAFGFSDSTVADLNGMVRFEWDALDEWFEEDEQVFVHPRDPYTRIDILPSSRHIQVEVDGVLVADSHQPRILFETGLPPRYYLPKSDVRMDLLVASHTHTGCPYKGTASYYDIDLPSGRRHDLVWWYPTPLPESQKVAGLVCFYNEKVDLTIDGVPQERPRTPFS